VPRRGSSRAGPEAPGGGKVVGAGGRAAVRNLPQEHQAVFAHTGPNAEFAIVKPDHLATYFGEPFDASEPVMSLSTVCIEIIVDSYL
jgi:hypothetical protein